MPLLRKKEFQKTSIPELLRDDEEVFHCVITNEIFRDYDEFCQRIILVNSMVWSCAMTGKSNLTYAEALQSEKAAKKSLKDFPVELRIPVLFLASKTKRSAFGDMAEDIFSFVKDRYFVGEIVESSFTENNWRESYVLQVIGPNDDVQTQKNTIPTSKTPERNFLPASTTFRYEVEQIDANDQDSTQVMIVEANHIRRKKGPFSKEKLRLFLKQFVELNEYGIIVIKESIKRKYKLDKVRFDQLFDGPLPEFEQSKKIPKGLVNGKIKDKKVRQEMITSFISKGNTANGKTANGKSLIEEMKKKEAEYKQKLEEMKQKRNEEKQKRKEESVRVATYVKDWYKPRDDLLLEDQKPLHPPTLVQTKIPAQFFGDTLMIIEFVNSFSTLLSTKDFFPYGLTMELLERALTEMEVAGPLSDLIQMLLSAIFTVQNEEAAENKRSKTDLNSEDLTESMSLSEAARLATLASNWSMVYQGLSLNRLPLYPVTISEILRLHLLSSGARLSEAATKWRYQQRGGYLSEDDPGLALRLSHPHILKALSVHNVNQLPISDKIKIISCLIDQLLTYADVRDVIEDRLEKSRQSKNELRSLQIAERKHESDYASSKLKLKKEFKADSQQFIKELEKLELETDKKRAEFDFKIKEIIKSLPEHQTVLGTDRAFQKYVKIDSIPGFFVENNEQNYGICLDKIIAQKPELIGAEQKDTLDYVKQLYEINSGSDKENDNGLKKNPKKINGSRNSIKLENEINAARDLFMCTANNHPCPVHSNVNKPTWSFYHDKSDIEKLISSLNKRGSRENELRQILEIEKEYLEKIVSSTNASKLNSTIAPPVEENQEQKRKKIPKALRYEESHLGYPQEMDLNEILSLSLIDHILEMEEKIHSGSLGQLKAKDRAAWRNNLSNKRFNELDKTLIKKEENSQLEKIKVEGKNNSRPGTPDSGVYKDPGKYLKATFEMNGHSIHDDIDEIELKPSDEQLNSVKTLAIALMQIAQAVESKYLIKPLGQADASGKKKEEKNVIERWEQSLMASTSYSQVFLHYCTLENCIKWSSSTLFARCQICRRKKNAEIMLLCDKCNKGHHLYCLKPKLTAVPEGDWFCDKCKPQEESTTPRPSRRARKIFTEEEEEEEEEEEDDEDEDEEEDKENATNNSDEDYKEQETEVSMFEVCEVCGSGGHVICCDFCPRVYHLECTQPVLRRVPRGEWKCHKCKGKSDKKHDSVDPLYVNGNEHGTMEEVAQTHRGPGVLFRRRCATQARTKIHNFARTLRRTSVDSSSSDDVPLTQRRSTRRTNEYKDDDLPLHNAALQELLADVMKHKDSWPFTRPVTKQEVPDYFDVIKNPMDFGTIKYKLNMGEYQQDEQLMIDAALVFENCDTYNNSDADVYKCGVRLLKYFEKRSRDLGLSFPTGVMGNPENVDDDDGPTQPKRSRNQ